MRRRTFLRTSSLGFCALACRSAAQTPDPADIATAFDAEIEAFMQPRKVPGAALAVTKNGRLVYAKAYGLADREHGTPVTNESLFRIASISKPITAAAVLQLVETGGLARDACPFEVLG